MGEHEDRGITDEDSISSPMGTDGRFAPEIRQEAALPAHNRVQELGVGRRTDAGAPRGWNPQRSEFFSLCTHGLPRVG